MKRFFPTLLTMLLAAALLVAPAHADEHGDTSQFLSGLSKFQAGSYGTATKILEEMLAQHPDTPLRDLALALLSRSYLKLGKKDVAGSYTARLLKEYPATPLTGQLEKELVTLATNLLKQKPLSIASSKATKSAQTVDNQAFAPLNPEEKTERIRQKPEEEQLTKAKEKAEKDRLAKEQAERERLALLKVEEERLAKEKIEKERFAKEQAERERLALLKVEEERLAKEKIEKERFAKEQAERERLALLKVEEERLAKEKIEKELLAKEQAERERLALLKAEEQRLTSQTQRFASVSMALTPVPSAAIPVATAAQPADTFQLDVRNEVVAPVGTEVPFPVVVNNTGKMVPDLSWQTPSSVKIRVIDGLRHAGGETASGTLGILIPTAIDGSRFHLNMKAVTTDGQEAVSEVTVIASAPLLRAVARGTKKLALPGEMVEFRIVILNAGSLAAEEAELVIDLPQYVDIVNPGNLVVKSRDRLENNLLKIKPGEAKELPVRIRISSFANKGQEIRISGSLISPQGEQKFSSPPVVVRLAD